MRGAVRITGEDGIPALVIDQSGIASLAVGDLVLRDLISRLLEEAVKMNFHLSILTGEELTSEELGEE